MEENGKNCHTLCLFPFFLLTVRQDKNLSPEQGLEPWTVRLKA